MKEKKEKSEGKTKKTKKKGGDMDLHS